MRHEHAPAARVDRWNDIGFQGIANHHRLSWPRSMAREDFFINRWCLVRHDFDPVKKIAQPRLRQLTLLIQKVTFGDQQDLEISGQRFNHFARVGQKLDRVLQHILSRFDQLANDRCRHPFFCHLNRRFDHRQNEALDAEPVMTQVPLLCRQQTIGKMVRLGVVDKQVREPFLGQLEELFVLPKRVVGIKAQRGECRHYTTSLSQWAFSQWSEGLYSAPMMVQLSLTTADMVSEHFMMADKKDGTDGDVGVVLDTRTKTQRPPMYKVMLLNDDYTPMEFVVHVLERFFGMTHAQAFELMLTVHKKGLAVVGVFSYEVAETKVAQVMDFAQRHQHPLQCTMEKE